MVSIAKKLEGFLPGVSYQGMSRKLLMLMLPYWRRVLPLILLQVTSALLGAVAASLALPLLLVIAGGVQAGVGQSVTGLARAYAVWLSGRSLVEQLQLVALAFVALNLAKSALSFQASLAVSRFTSRLSADLRVRMLDLYVGTEYQFFLDRRQGRILNDLNDEPGRAAEAVMMFLDWGQQFLSGALLVVVLLAISWPATLVAGAVGLGIAVVLARLRVRALGLGKETLINKRHLSSLSAEAVSGIRQIKIFGAEAQVRRQFTHLVTSNVRIRHSTARLALIPGLVGEVSAVVLVGLVFFGLGWLQSDRLVVVLPVAGAFFVVLRQLMPIVTRLSAQRVKLYTHVPVLDFILSTMRDVPSERSLRESGQGIVFEGLREAIVFEDVTFRYQPGESSDIMPTFDNWMEKHLDRAAGLEEQRGLAPPPLVLKRLNLIFERGKRSALVGPSGAGKSTVVDLLVRLFDPQEGRITVDGINLRDIDLRSWRSRIGYVSQDTFIFNGTVRDNIAFAKPEASQDEIEHAARPPLHHGIASRIRNGCWRPRHEALGRAAPADRHRAHVGLRPPDPDSR
jgi:ABC-type multidrug transport system fused ATPase/permease subunit